jgi:hypothetical protein
VLQNAYAQFVNSAESANANMAHNERENIRDTWIEADLATANGFYIDVLPESHFDTPLRADV